MRALSKAFSKDKGDDLPGHTHTHTPDSHIHHTYTQKRTWCAFVYFSKACKHFHFESSRVEMETSSKSIFCGRQAAVGGKGCRAGQVKTVRHIADYIQATFALLQLQRHLQMHLHLYPHAKLQIWYVNFALVVRIIQITWHRAPTWRRKPQDATAESRGEESPEKSMQQRKWLHRAECNLGRFAASAAHQQIGESLPGIIGLKSNMQSVFASSSSIKAACLNSEQGRGGTGLSYVW